MAIIKKKVRAATLIEAIIAMIIVVLCFGIATMIYLNVISSGNKALKIKANLVIDELAIQAKKDKNFIDEKMILDDMTIVKKTEPYQQIENLNQLSFTAFDKNDKYITDHTEIIIIENK